MKQATIQQTLSKYKTELSQLGVKSLDLFGSTVRGEADEASDIDLLVEFNHEVGFFEFLEVKEFLEKILNHAIDLGTPASLHPRLKERVLREARRVA